MNPINGQHHNLAVTLEEVAEAAAAARTIAERIVHLVIKRGLLEPRTTQTLSKEGLAATRALMRAIQAVHERHYAARTRAAAAPTQLERLEVDQEAWEAIEEGEAAIAQALLDLSRAGIAVFIGTSPTPTMGPALVLT